MSKYYLIILLISILLGCGRVASYKQEVITLVVTPAKSDLYYSK